MNVCENSTSSPKRSRRIRVGVLIAMTVVAVGITVCLPPLGQDPSYHRFADRRTVLGVPNFYNGASNAAFVLVGAAALLFLIRDAGAARRGEVARFSRTDRYTFGAMFAGLFLTGFGSAWYHLEPSNATLFWDRLPMSIALMGFLAGMIAERISRRAGAYLLVPLLLFGVAGVAYWRLTERWGEGDLRFYGLVQAFPLAALPYVALAFPASLLPSRSLLIALGWYALAKALEHFDAAIYQFGGILSGHTLKHLAAAMGTFWILRAMFRNTKAHTLGPAAGRERARNEQPRK